MFNISISCVDSTKIGDAMKKIIGTQPKQTVKEAGPSNCFFARMFQISKSCVDSAK